MQQLSLLGGPPLPTVPGLAYVAEYVTREEERELIAAIDREPWRTEWQRRRQVYGVSYGSAVSTTPQTAPSFPAWLSALAARIVGDGWLADDVVNAVINEYLPGQGIGAHRDYPGFGPTVVAVSLGSACILELDHPTSHVKELLDVEPRSLWVLGGEARSDWRHGIAARRADIIDGIKRPRERRISVTLRTSTRARRDR